MVCAPHKETKNEVRFYALCKFFFYSKLNERLQSFGCKPKLIGWYKLDLWTYLYHFVKVSLFELRPDWNADLASGNSITSILIKTTTLLNAFYHSDNIHKIHLKEKTKNWQKCFQERSFLNRCWHMPSQNPFKCINYCRNMRFFLLHFN